MIKGLLRILSVIEGLFQKPEICSKILLHGRKYKREKVNKTTKYIHRTINRITKIQSVVEFYKNHQI